MNQCPEMANKILNEKRLFYAHENYFVLDELVYIHNVSSLTSGVIQLLSCTEMQNGNTQNYHKIIRAIFQSIS